MNSWTQLITALSNANPMVLIAAVSVVALVVVGQCVRHMCKAFGTKGGK